MRNVLELLRRIINFGVSQQLCSSLNWTIKLPKPDPDSERIEVLTDEQFQKLHEVWACYHDRHIAHLHQFIGWSGSRPSEVLKLLWMDVDMSQRFYIKRDTKSGKSLTFPMSTKLHSILQQQRELLDSSPEAMRTSSFVFPGPDGGQRKLHSYPRHFRRIRNHAVIPQDYRPNYCLRDTVASRLLSSGATLDEVAYQLGHSPGSPMTRRYASFLAPSRTYSFAPTCYAGASQCTRTDTCKQCRSSSGRKTARRTMRCRRSRRLTLGRSERLQTRWYKTGGKRRTCTPS